MKKIICRALLIFLLPRTLQAKESVFSYRIQKKIISNPDVEQHNSQASFTIDGEPRLCTVVYYTECDFEQPGDELFVLGETGLVPIDNLSMLYNSTETEDFWDVFGENTIYVTDPEEALADNFAYALVYGMNREYSDPEIIEAMQEYLTQ